MNSRGQSFLQKLSERIMVGDGAFGTRFFQKGLPLDISYENFNITKPHIVEEILREYKDSGAEVLETNTFCTNRIKQSRFGKEDIVREQARRGAEIARSVAGDQVFVAGSVGPLSRKRRELDGYSQGDLEELFREPMKAMVEGGVDVLYLETFSLLSELEIALKVALEFDVPVIAQMAFGDEGTTQMGVTAERATRRLDELGAHVIGSNCRSGPHILVDIVARQSRVTNKPLSVYPNAGYAQQVEGRFIYQASPEYFGEKALEMVRNGANLIGGCCGTGPDHVRAMVEAVKNLQPGPRVYVPASMDEPSSIRISEEGKKFLSLMTRDEPFVTVEVECPKDFQLKRVFDGAKELAKAGCDAFNVPDNPLAIVRTDNVIFAELLRQNVDMPVILHLTCRDKNVIALQSDLLGAHLVGIESVLAITGDPAAIGDQPGASSVYDVNSIGLVEIIHNMNRGISASGGSLKEPTNFAIGVAVNSNVSGPKGLDGVFSKLAKKIEAGAQFAETQPMYDEKVLLSFLTKAKEASIPICVGLMPLVSFKNAEFMHNEVPGIRISEEVRESFRGLEKENARAKGVELTKRLVDLAKAQGVKHFYLITPLQRYDMIAEIVSYIKGK